MTLSWFYLLFLPLTAKCCRTESAISHSYQPLNLQTSLYKEFLRSRLKRWNYWLYEENIFLRSNSLATIRTCRFPHRPSPCIRMFLFLYIIPCCWNYYCSCFCNYDSFLSCSTSSALHHEIIAPPSKFFSLYSPHVVHLFGKENKIRN